MFQLRLDIIVVNISQLKMYKNLSLPFCFVDVIFPRTLKEHTDPFIVV
jgi:hypothetical protein